jgi:general secretion pathway protein G
MVAKREQGGFTLIELLIVIIILAILAAIVVFAVGSTNSNAIASSCNADAKSVETAVQAYEAQLPGQVPANIAALTTSLGTTVNGVSETVGPWLKEAPSTANYNISLDGSGNVQVGKAGSSTGSSYDTTGADPCNTLGS